MEKKILKTILKSYPSYRYKQVNEAVYKNFINNWKEASNLPQDLKDKLSKECPLDYEAEILKSSDNKTIKILLTLKDGLKIESVLMRHGKRNTVCVSSQVGCVLGCIFCNTGKIGFKRNLEASEIVDQVLFFSRYIKNNISKKEKVNNIVFMGMGEPFLNYTNVMESIGFMHDSEIFNLGSRRFSISTIGLPDEIKKFAKEDREINLAVSIHAPNDKLRSKLIPVNKKYPLEKVFSSIYYYIERTNRKVMIEYLLIKDINDSILHAKELAKLIKSSLMVVNLIAYNSGRNLKPSSRETISIFKNTLEKLGVQTTERFRLGQDIKGACGQLAGDK